jgi:adenine-specific DNA-methyltransferase
VRLVARRVKRKEEKPVNDYRHEEARRKNNPPAGAAPTYEAREHKVQRYAYDPHLDPQLVWAGKAEHTSFEVDVVSLHIHERVSTRAILEAARKPQPVQMSMFAAPELPLDKQIEFYRHDVNWANRLILGDSLLVMNSLLVKEGMAGKVQMIYVDPPYGIKYASNFQPRLDQRDVKDKDEDLTREPEQIKAYRDTWKLGIHSYLTYLRDRLLLCRELLHESGSIFVQINDENLHLVRCLLDEVFGRENFVSIITFAKTSGFQSTALTRSVDYLVWYAKDAQALKYRALLVASEKPAEHGYRWLRFPDGYMRALTAEEIRGERPIPQEAELYKPDNIKSQGATSSQQDFEFRGKVYHPGPNSHWKTTVEGMWRLATADRIHEASSSIQYVRIASDYSYRELHNVWEDTSTGQFTEEKLYAVQTATKVIERCILMTTDPGDLVFDPTCGSGTTAYCAEKWGRRWITCDTSRVALNIARQRLLTARFDYYELRDSERGPGGGFIYESVPHITLESIAKNMEIDEIAAKYQPGMDAALAALNQALGKAWREWEVPRPVPHPLWPKSTLSAYRELYRLKDDPAPEAQNRAQELLEMIYRETGHRLTPTVPAPVPGEDWPEAAEKAFAAFWELKQQKRREIDASIQRNAPQETLYDRPQVKRGVVRVTGPFTVEAIPVPMVEDPGEAPVPAFEEEEARARVSDAAGDYLTTMLNLLKQSGGVIFPGNKKMALSNLRPLNVGILHAEAETGQNGETLKVALSFGPPHGPVTAVQTDEAIRTARRSGYDILVLAGFSIEASAQALVQETKIPGLSVHFANIAPDVLVGDLLKTTRASQLFTVFGQPDVTVHPRKDGTFVAALRGVDIYDPTTGAVHHTRGEDVAAWFLDTDYDGMTFHICQAFFPGDPDAWDKLQRALRAQIDPEAFAKMRGTASFPFKPGEHNRIAVKVIDFRGNEVVKVVE